MYARFAIAAAIAVLCVGCSARAPKVQVEPPPPPLPVCGSGVTAAQACQKVEPIIQGGRQVAFDVLFMGNGPDARLPDGLIRDQERVVAKQVFGPLPDDLFVSSIGAAAGLPSEIPKRHGMKVGHLRRYFLWRPGERYAPVLVCPYGVLPGTECLLGGSNLELERLASSSDPTGRSWTFSILASTDKHGRQAAMRVIRGLSLNVRERCTFSYAVVGLPTPPNVDNAWRENEACLRGDRSKRTHCSPKWGPPHETASEVTTTCTFKR